MTIIVFLVYMLPSSEFYKQNIRESSTNNQIQDILRFLEMNSILPAKSHYT